MKRKGGPRRIFHLRQHTGEVVRNVDDEIHFHLLEQTEKLIENGWDPSAAQQEALRRFGNEHRIREECLAIGKARIRRRKMGEAVSSFFRDVRVSMRTLRKESTFTGFAVGSLALGIGVNIVVFTLFYTVLFDPLPYPEEDRLLFVEETSPAWQIERMGFSYPDLVDFQEQATAFSHFAGFLYGPRTLTGQGEPERLLGCEVSAVFLDALGVQPTVGRGLRPEDEGEGAEAVVLISAGLWNRRFGGDRGVIGRAISLGGEPTTIIGVLPRHFRFPEAADLWTPFRKNRTENRGINNIGVVGRLGPGSQVQDAEAELGRIARNLGEVHWGSTDALGAQTQPLRRWLLGDWRTPALAFYSVVCLVLLLACANVANLLMARNTTRRKEMAVRASLGAGRLRLFRQLLTEGITLTVLGGLLGAVFGFLGRDLLIGLSPVDLPPFLSFSLRPIPVLIIAGIILTCGILFSLGPAFAAMRTDVGDTLRSENTRVSSGRGRVRLRSILVAVQLAMALIVLTGGGLMFKSLIRQLQTDPGFVPTGVMSLRLDIPEAHYRDETLLQDLYRRLREDVRALPGITSASITTDLPTGRIPRDGNTFAEGADLGSAKAPIYPFSFISPGFFSTLEIPVLQGRDFTYEDGLGDAPQAVIVNDRFAQLHWPNQDPIGKRIARGEGPPSSEAGWATVVGVVEGTFTDGFGQPIRPAVYRPIHWEPAFGVFLVARSTMDGLASFEQLRNTIVSIDPGIPISLPRTMSRALLEENWQTRFFTWLFGIFSLLAVFLASAGVYGVMSFAVANRSKEFALRMAVGAQPGAVERMVWRWGLGLSAVGLTLGLVASVAGARFLSGMLFQVRPTDLQVYFFATAILAAIALLAGYVPAHRILRIDPMANLREE